MTTDTQKLREECENLAKDFFQDLQYNDSRDDESWKKITVDAATHLIYTLVHSKLSEQEARYQEEMKDAIKIAVEIAMKNEKEFYQSELEALAVKIEELQKSWKPIFLAEVANLYAKEFMSGIMQGLSDAASLIRQSMTNKQV